MVTGNWAQDESSQLLDQTASTNRVCSFALDGQPCTGELKEREERQQAEGTLALVKRGEVC
jgi:hypothetical protein